MRVVILEPLLCALIFDSRGIVTATHRSKVVLEVEKGGYFKLITYHDAVEVVHVACIRVLERDVGTHVQVIERESDHILQLLDLAAHKEGTAQQRRQFLVNSNGVTSTKIRFRSTTYKLVILNRFMCRIRTGGHCCISVVFLWGRSFLQ